MLIQEIDSIIESIVEPNYFLTSQNTVVPLSKKATQSLNCYAYALGITFSGNSKQHYFPGFTIQKFPLIIPKLLCKFFTIISIFSIVLGFTLYMISFLFKLQSVPITIILSPFIFCNKQGIDISQSYSPIF